MASDGGGARASKAPKTQGPCHPLHEMTELGNPHDPGPSQPNCRGAKRQFDPDLRSGSLMPDAFDESFKMNLLAFSMDDEGCKLKKELNPKNDASRKLLGPFSDQGSHHQAAARRSEAQVSRHFPRPPDFQRPRVRTSY